MSFGQEQGHGHVVRRLDGAVANCRGPEQCDICKREVIVENARLNEFARCTFCNTETPRNQVALEAHLFSCQTHPLGKRLRAAESVIRLASDVLINDKAGIGGGRERLAEAVDHYQKSSGALSDESMFRHLSWTSFILASTKGLGVRRRGLALYVVGMIDAIFDEEKRGNRV